MHEIWSQDMQKSMLMSGVNISSEIDVEQDINKAWGCGEKSEITNCDYTHATISSSVISNNRTSDHKNPNEPSKSMSI